jgi:hypothetical protein
MELETRRSAPLGAEVVVVGGVDDGCSQWTAQGEIEIVGRASSAERSWGWAVAQLKHAFAPPDRPW